MIDIEYLSRDEQITCEHCGAIRCEGNLYWFDTQDTDVCFCSPDCAETYAAQQEEQA